VTIEFDLAGRRALVTGSGQGVGRAIALSLAGAGAEVLVNDVRDERAREVVEEIAAAGGAAARAVFDVTDFAAVCSAVDTNGGVDILVNNAGNAGTSSQFGLVRFVDTEPADWQPFLQVNLYGVMHCTRAALPRMIERRWGRVITIVSDAGRVGGARLAAYSAAKAGAAALTRSVALENGRHGITANNVSLGTMGALGAEGASDEPDPHLESLLRSYAVRRVGSPADVAPLVLLLASEHGAWITGQTYPVNGGFSFAL
jgi:NAD(P)-dependent dehydrogenase (short-subunit alcohol dehydrogenase family)